MVAKSFIITNRMNNPPVNPILVRETVQKVERCMARLQELQSTVTGSTEIISGRKLSPHSCRRLHRTCLRCKQGSFRVKSLASQRSPAMKIREMAEAQEWRKMSLPAMLLNETVAEIIQASKLVSRHAAVVDPITPDSGYRRRKPSLENTELRARRANEKGLLSRTLRSESGSPMFRRARSRISFKETSPLSKKEAMNIPVARSSVSVNRVLPKNRPWTKKTVLFPNQLFLSASPGDAHQKRFYKTRSPIIARTSQAPHKFLIKSPRTTLGSQFKSKKAVPGFSVSPVMKGKGSASKPWRCSLSSSKFVNRLVSPLKTRLSLSKVGGGGSITGLKQKPSNSAGVKLSSARLK